MEYTIKELVIGRPYSSLRRTGEVLYPLDKDWEGNHIGFTLKLTSVRVSPQRITSVPIDLRAYKRTNYFD